MTVSTSVGRQFTIDRIIKISYKHARLRGIAETPDENEIQFGRESLEIILDELAVSGEFARVMDFEVVAITVDVAEYTLPSRVLDLLSPAMYIDPTNTDITKADGETPIELVAPQEWTKYSSKAAKGRPTKFFADRTGDLVKAVLWPRPDESGGSVRFLIHRELADSDDGNATLDLKNYWMGYIVSALAQRLASAAGLDQHAMVLTAEAENKLRMARGKANERATNQIVVTHRVAGVGGWNG